MRHARRWAAVVFASVVLILLSADGGRAADDVFSQEKCSICHVRQSVYFDPSFLSSQELKGFSETRLCFSCHDGSVQDSRDILWRGSQHPDPSKKAGANRPCSACHSPHSKGGGWDVIVGTGLSISRSGGAVCQACHSKGDPSFDGIHKQNFSPNGCRECHRAHGGVGKALLRDSQVALCLKCHAGVDGAKTGGHPLSRGAGSKSDRDMPECTGCHPLHSSAPPSEAVLGQCAKCHSFDDPLSVSGERRGHPDKANCLQCHTFHKSSAPDGRSFRGVGVSVESVCGKCHPGMKGAVRELARGQGTHVTFSPKEKRNLCFVCHRIHGAVAGTSLLRTDKERSCLACHATQNTISETGDVALAHPSFEKIDRTRLTGVVRQRNRPVGPTGEIVCRTCHSVHGSVPGSVLLPKGADGGEICFWCHEGFRAKSHDPGKPSGGGSACTSCHPVHGRTGLGPDPWKSVCSGCHKRPSQHKLGMEDRVVERPKDLPLFDSRGRADRYGGLSCPTCHEPHDGTRGDWRLRRPYLNTAFICTACHQVFESVALTPHDLRGIAGKSPCDPCHVPHGGSTPWMSGLSGGSGRDVIEEQCRACHREKGLAGDFGKGGHPVNVVPGRSVPDGTPLFSPAGERGNKGVVSCSTCHEVHGTGLLPSGGGVGDLLRTEITCEACHGNRTEKHGGATCAKCHPPHGDVTPSAACVSCHKGKDAAGIGVVHTASGKSCGTCHSIHGDKSKERPTDASCSGCHQKAGRIVGTPHADIGANACAPCHPAHGASEPVHRPKRRAWEQTFEPDLPCLTCHRDGGSASALANSEHPMSRKEVPTSYGAKVIEENRIVMASRWKEDGKPTFPLFDTAGKQVLTGSPGCLTCHDPHASGVGGKGVKYLRDPQGDFISGICIPCHREKARDSYLRFHKAGRTER